MTGTQLSLAWSVAQAAESLAASIDEGERSAGRALRCCEATGVERLPGSTKVKGTQGVNVSLRFYAEADLDAVKAREGAVRSRIAQALGLWDRAVQLDVEILAGGPWLG